MRLFHAFSQSPQENPEIIFLIWSRPLHFIFPQHSCFTMHPLTRHYTAWAADNAKRKWNPCHNHGGTNTYSDNTSIVFLQCGCSAIAAAGEDGQYGWHLALAVTKWRGELRTRGMKPSHRHRMPRHQGHNRTHQKTSANRKLCYPLPLQVRGGRWEVEWTNEKPPIWQPWYMNAHIENKEGSLH